jgi:simple sugar transport system ATP-binding protein
VTAERGGARDVVLRLRGITKRFGPLVANDAIDLDLHRGEVLALLGENGAGKTTLMNILFGHYVADRGEVHVFGAPLPPGNPRAALSAGIGMVHQHFTLADNLTTIENIVLGTESLMSFGRGRAAAAAQVAALSRDFGLSVRPDAKVGTLSVGERQRVEILKALYREARILILDEPTAVLTPQETTALFATLKRAVEKGLSIIFISHKLREVLAVSDRCVVLRHGRVTGQVGTRDTSREALAAMMVGNSLPESRVAAGTPGPALLRLDGVTTPDRGTAPGLRGVTLALHAGQITGLAGVSGNGQAALADLIGGLARPAEGRMEIAGEAPTAGRPEPRWRRAWAASPRTGTGPAPSLISR